MSIRLTSEHIFDYINELSHCVAATYESEHGNSMQMFYHPISQELLIYKNKECIGTFEYPGQVENAVYFYNQGGY